MITSMKKFVNSGSRNHHHAEFCINPNRWTSSSAIWCRRWRSARKSDNSTCCLREPSPRASPTTVPRKDASQRWVGRHSNLKGADKIRELQGVDVKKSRPAFPPSSDSTWYMAIQPSSPSPWPVVQLGHSCHRAQRPDSSARSQCRRHLLDLQSDGWYRPGCALGTHRRGQRRRPVSGSRIAEAMVRGYQGDPTRRDNIMACVKHFALWGCRIGTRL